VGFFFLFNFFYLLPISNLRQCLKDVHQFNLN